VSPTRAGNPFLRAFVKEKAPFSEEKLPRRVLKTPGKKNLKLNPLGKTKLCLAPEFLLAPKRDPKILGSLLNP